MNTSQPSNDSIRVLHVDDDETQLLMMREFLLIFDPEIEIDSVINPLKVEERLNKTWYDCIIMDYQMPEMTGIDLARNIRKENSIPIILYTGRGSEEVAEKAFSVGVTDYFRKELSTQHYQVLAKRIRDVVEKQRMEKVYTSIIKEASDSVVVAVDEKLVFANKAFIDLVGVSSISDLMGVNILDLLNNVDKNSIRNEIESLLKDEKSYVISELELRRKDSKNVPVEVNTSVLDYFGKKSILFFIRDIRERKVLEDEIKKSETKYRSLFELAPDGIITINLKGDVTWINPAYSTITGYTREEIVGKKIWSLSPVRASDVKMFFKLFVNLIKGKSIPPLEFQWISKDGKQGWGEGRASLLKINNKMTEVLLITRDITARKLMEEDLRKYSKDMEHLADERARKLLDSEKMIAAGAIASTVAHDLRGPLGAIRNAVYLMDLAPEKSDEMKKIIMRALENATEMLNNIRSKTAEDVLNLEEVEIASFIKSVITETPIPSWITVRSDLKEATVLIDKLRIRRVLENLIRNAIDAMPESGKLQINSKKAENRIMIEIKDTGTGIPDNILRDLFKPFQTTKVKGTGLGLYYCEKTLEAHGGTIDVKSKIGKGTKVTLEIPLKTIMEREIESLTIVSDSETHQAENQDITQLLHFKL